MSLTTPSPDVTINVPPRDSLSTNTATAITHFLTARTIGVFGPRPSGLGALVQTLKQAGENLSRNRKFGHSDYKDRDSAFEDRIAVPTGQKYGRVSGKYKIKDQYWAIKEDTPNESQVDIAMGIREDMDELSTRVEAQVLIDELETVTYGTSVNDGLGTIASTLQWDETNGETVLGTKARGLSVQKLAEADTMFKYSHVQSGLGRVLLTSPNAVRGMTGSDRQSINQDYAAFANSRSAWGIGAMSAHDTYVGYRIVEIGAYASHTNKNGTTVPQGLKVNTRTVGSENNVDIENNYAFCSNVDCLSYIQTASPELNRFYSDIWMEKSRATLMFRWSAYLGAAIWNPKGIIQILNRV